MIYFCRRGFDNNIFLHFPRARIRAWLRALYCHCYRHGGDTGSPVFPIGTMRTEKVWSISDSIVVIGVVENATGLTSSLKIMFLLGFPKSCSVTSPAGIWANPAGRGMETGPNLAGLIHIPEAVNGIFARSIGFPCPGTVGSRLMKPV